MRKGRYRDIGSDTLGREIDRQCTRERVCIRERERESSCHYFHLSLLQLNQSKETKLEITISTYEKAVFE